MMGHPFNHQSSHTQLNVLQVTDMHLFADPTSTLVGLNTEETFLSVLQHAQKTHWPPDLILFTGDISQDSSEAAYLRLQAHLKPLGIPCYALPGNHDVPTTLKQVASDPIHQQAFLHLEHWLIAFLDSTIPNGEGGQLQIQEIEALEQELSKHPTKPTLICLHHQLLPVGSTWLDTMAVHNPDLLIHQIERHPQIKAIAHGHVHQDFSGEVANRAVFSAPSTCFQFEPKSVDFAVDDIAPGYRWLVLHDDGRIETGVERLPDVPEALERHSGGY